MLQKRHALSSFGRQDMSIFPACLPFSRESALGPGSLGYSAHASRNASMLCDKGNQKASRFS
jgi:hypothetical protein